MQCADGAEYAIAQPTSFRLCYGLGSPCDSFQMTCPWIVGQEGLLEVAVRLRVRHAGALVFFGVVDEVDCALRENGYTLEIVGRGVQALLLDNEAMSADYGVATLEDILRAYVLPFGISVQRGAALPSVTGFSVSSGSSCWQVLYQFARYHGGVAPRFDQTGALLLSPWKDEAVRCLDDAVPIISLSLRYQRYGVLSEVTVQNRATMAVQTVKNEAFLKAGGACRRVLTVPRNTGYQSMRYTAQFQLEESARSLRRVELCVALPFVAWPGERVTLARTGFGGNGSYRVLEATVSLGGQGYETRLILVDPSQKV